MVFLATPSTYRISTTGDGFYRNVVSRSPDSIRATLVPMVTTTAFDWGRRGLTFGSVELMPKTVAVIVGANGGIGGALSEELSRNGDFDQVVRLNRPALNFYDEPSIVQSAAKLPSGCVHLVINAAGLLHDSKQQPEKSLRDINSDLMANSFAVNAIGPALLMKHFFPLLPRQGRVVFANLSARVGSIGDNGLGGWYGYRASKAALNQLIRTAAIELARTHPDSICVALHPGTVATRLSEPFVGNKRSPHTPIASARHLLQVIANLTPDDSGRFFDWRGESIPW